jgi:cellulose synthase/poly-beta-1,6-N-acetylglucosamine synthase-like glycosyltransferase
VLRQIIIVASKCHENVLSMVEALAILDTRILLIRESERRGKAEAINKILGNLTQDYAVFVNGDALPDAGAIGTLLSTIRTSDSIGVVTGSPFFDQKEDSTSRVEHLMWTIHNECSSELNNSDQSNHGSDEMMVIRTGLVGRLPLGLVNDGAFIAGMARMEGFSIRFCRGAGVLIDVPKRMGDLIRQRRRIIVGHFQVWKLTGKPPKTVESLLLFSPLTSLGIISKLFAREPKLLKDMPLAVMSEAISFAYALKDMILGSNSRHGVWERYDN